MISGRERYVKQMRNVLWARAVSPVHVHSKRVVHQLTRVVLPIRIAQNKFRISRNLHSRVNPIPVVISQHLLEMYNGGIATAMNLPKISETVTKHLNPTLEIRLGRSFISRGKIRLDAQAAPKVSRYQP